MNFPTCLADAALWYAERGWPVFPVVAKGKRPLVDSGFHAATTDRQTIEAWWRRWPAANIGIPTGITAFVVDYDSAEVVKAHPPEQTPRARTGRGLQAFYAPSELRGKPHIEPTLDTRATGNYVVVPPSVHATGAVYTWEVEPFNGTPLAPIPSWVLAHYEQPRRTAAPPVVSSSSKYGAAALKRACATVAALPKGGRAQGLYDEAYGIFRLVAGGAVDHADARAGLEDAGRACGLGADEVRHALSSAEERGKQSPKTAPEPSVRAPDAPPSSDWRQGLLLTRTGSPRPWPVNVEHALRHHPALRGLWAWDVFSQRPAVVGETPWHGDAPPRAWTDADTVNLTVLLDREGLHVGIDMAHGVICTLAHERTTHPVREYLDALRWDGVERIGTWLTNYLGAELTAYHCEVGARWLISACARIYEPGCQADHMLVLEGKQGLGKSSALKILGDQWYTDQVPELDSKDASQSASGAWIHEMSELDQMGRAEASTAKAFISRRVDRYRPPYGRLVVEVPRSCVFAGTTNGDHYLRDDTGARRFWPVACTAIDRAGLARDRDQLWAEALRAYRSGRPHWIDSEELTSVCADEQEERRARDPWQETIGKWLVGQVDVSVVEVLAGALEIEPGRRTRVDAMRAGVCLGALGWVRYQTARPARAWRYRRGTECLNTA